MHTQRIINLFFVMMILSLLFCGEVHKNSTTKNDSTGEPISVDGGKKGIAGHYKVTTQLLNGTWLNPYIELGTEAISKKFSWGEGKTVPNTTFEIDLGTGKLVIGGIGLYYIKTTEEMNGDSVVINAIYYFKEDEAKKRGNFKEMQNSLLTKITIHFIDNNLFWIECSELDGMTATGNNQHWVRLSGPTGN